MNKHSYPLIPCDNTEAVTRLSSYTLLSHYFFLALTQRYTPYLRPDSLYSTSQKNKTTTGWEKSSVAWGGGVSKFPRGNRDFRICSDPNSDITSVLETSKSGAKPASDKKVGFSRHLRCALADFYGHYSSRDLHVYVFQKRH